MSSRSAPERRWTRDPWQLAALVGALALAAALQWPLLRADPLLSRDDRTLIDPLRSLRTPAEYAQALAGHRLMDVQPLRDASFAVNLWLERRTGHGLFHATNLALWFAIVLLLRRLLGGLRGVSPWVATTAACLFAVHPALLLSVSWVAARKHLLSCLGILVATVLVVEAHERSARPRRQLAVVAAYTLSVFAQPITLLWPAWVAARAWLEGREGAIQRARVALLCAPVMVACGAINALYYSGEYVAQAGATKFAEGFNPAVSLLALGRAFFNAVAPLWVVTAYDPGSWPNLAGLALLVAFGLWVARRLPRSEAVGWGLFALLPLAVVLTRMTQLFFSDTYLLTPAIGLTCLGAELAAPLAQARPAVARTARALSLATVVALAALSTAVARSWESEPELWARAHRLEPSPNVLAKHAFYLAQAGHFADAREVAMRLQEWDPTHPELGLVLGQAILHDPGLSLEEKNALLSGHAVPQPWYRYDQAIVRAGLGHFEEAAELMDEALQEPRAFKAELPAVVADATAVCVHAGRRGCDRLADRFRGEPGWSERRYRAAVEQRAAGRR